MQKHDYHDVVGGFSLIVLGGYASIYAATSLTIGTLNRMGPGFIPISAGIALIIFGLVIAVPAFIRSGIPRAVDLRAFLAITASIVLFALTAKNLGLVASVLITTIVAGCASKTFRFRDSLAIGVGLAIVSAAVFVFGLGVQLPLFSWNW